MANDLRIPCRKAIVAHLRADTNIDANIYGPDTGDAPVWPFVRYGNATVLPDRQSCNDGSLINVTLHCFAKGEDAATELSAAVAKSLDEPEIETEAGERLGIFWRGGVSLDDPDSIDGWQSTADFEITIASE